jgi:hypothetical protein
MVEQHFVNDQGTLKLMDLALMKIHSRGDGGLDLLADVPISRVYLQPARQSPGTRRNTSSLPVGVSVMNID